MRYYKSNTIGKNIKKYRKMKNMSQQMLADKIKADISAISRYESLKQYPSISTIKKISKELNIDPCLIMGSGLKDIQKLKNKIKTELSMVESQINIVQDNIIKIMSYIRELRRNRCITFSDLSKITGITLAYFSNIEQGHDKPTFEVCKILSNKLSVLKKEEVWDF